jgi:hypothetical protein
MPIAVVSIIGRCRRCMRIETRLPPVATAVPPSAYAIPSAVSPPARAEVSSGRNRTATPPTPSTAPISARAVIGVPNASRVPTRLMMTIVENRTATKPEAAYCSAR